MEPAHLIVIGQVVVATLVLFVLLPRFYSRRVKVLVSIAFAVHSSLKARTHFKVYLSSSSYDENEEEEDECQKKNRAFEVLGFVTT
jgi:hypothetical protein